MNVVDIPRAAWSEFLRRFLARHRDGLVNVRIDRSAPGVSADARSIALAGISLKEDGPATARVVVETRGLPGPCPAHVLDGVTRIRLLKDEEGGDAGLYAESSDGTRLLMHFCGVTVDVIPGSADR